MYKTVAAVRIHIRKQHPTREETGTQTLAGFNTRHWMCDECGATEEFSPNEQEPYAQHVCVLETDEESAKGSKFLHWIIRICYSF